MMCLSNLCLAWSAAAQRFRGSPVMQLRSSAACATTRGRHYGVVACRRGCIGCVLWSSNGTGWGARLCKGDRGAPCLLRRCCRHRCATAHRKPTCNPCVFIHIGRSRLGRTGPAACARRFGHAVIARIALTRGLPMTFPGCGSAHPCCMMRAACSHRGCDSRRPHGWVQVPLRSRHVVVGDTRDAARPSSQPCKRSPRPCLPIAQ
jgi:hypothetical protein